MRVSGTFDAFPNDIPSLQQLQLFDLYISGSLPSQVFQYSKLNTLVFSGMNMIEGTIPDVLNEQSLLNYFFVGSMSKVCV